MLALNHADFLTLWEAGSRLHPLDRSLLAIRTSLPANAGESVVADWPLGRRNRALAALRALYFGPRLEGWAVCASCGEKLEFELDCRALGEVPEPPAQASVAMDGTNFRLPTTRDLACIANETSPTDAVMRLLEICAVGGESKDAVGEILRGWPREKIDAVAEKMAEADPLAEISVGLECPVCKHAGEEPLDLASFVWSEIEARARQLLSEVHILASTYGWAEQTILTMSDERRCNYLQMVQT
jgi:hypothetical protein